MPKRRKWSDAELRKAVSDNKSYRGVIKTLGLVPAGGNYIQVKNYIEKLELDITHFTGKAWNAGLKYELGSKIPLDDLLKVESDIQSFKLKRRLFSAGLKRPACELCGWSAMSPDGRIPVELDHINGIRSDNRLENLRVLCPNCHSLQPTHRGKNKKVRFIGRVME